jgi:DNA polymerase elongation subunit (family B)
VNPGLYQNAAKIDVSSMYPSIQLLYGLCSRKDSERHYLSVLQYLKDARLELKQKYKETGDKKYHAQQNAFKILINGGYGFSGTGGYPYNCMQTAALVTAYGRRLIKLMIETLESSGATVIEVDTDGIFFSHSEPDNCLEVVQRSLPLGIDIELEAKNCSIYVPKKKNYIIYKPDGTVKVSGQFRSRNRCKLFKDFVVEYVGLMLQSNNEADAYYNNLCQQLTLGNYQINELLITQRIPKGDKTLQANNLGKIGDIVTYWWTGAITKRGVIKRKPTNSEPYLPEYYVKELAGLKSAIDEVIKRNASKGHS